MPYLSMKVVVLTGGSSPEYTASIESALHVLEHRKSLRKHLHLVPCLISRDERWLDIPTSERALDAYRLGSSEGLRQMDTIIREGNAAPPWEVLSDASVVFPIIHGALGEDGVILGLCRALRKPFIGCGILSSVICLEKAVCNAVLAQAGLPRTPYGVILSDDSETKAAMIAGDLRMPWIIKPSSGGCSIGVSLIRDASELSSALAKCRVLYPKSAIVIESAIEGALEIDVAVMEDFNGDLVVTPCGLRKNFDHTTASSASVQQVGSSPEHNQDQSNDPVWVVPAPELPQWAVEQMQTLAKRAFRVVRATGWLRVDFLYTVSDGKIYINEINTMPSLASGCMFFKLWQAAGLETAELIHRNVNNALSASKDGEASLKVGQS